MDQEVSGVNDQHARALRAGLRALAETSRQAGASRRVESVVLAEMAARARQGVPRRASRGTRWFSLAAAAMLVLASASGAWVASRADRRGPTLIRPAGFIELPGASVLPPLESGSIIRIALPVGALPQYGLAIPEYVVDGYVDADLLVAQDGEPRAIRLVQEMTRSSAP